MRKKLWQLIQYLRSIFLARSIQGVIMMAFAVVTITTALVVGGMLFIKFNNTIESNVMQSSYQTITQVEKSLQYYLQGMSDVLNIIDGELNSKDEEAIDMIKDQINMTLTLRKDIVTIALFTKDGRLLASNSDKNIKSGLDVTKEQWFSSVVNGQGYIYKSSSHVQNLFRGQHRWVVSVSKKVNAEIYGQPMEVIVLVDMNFSSIEQLCNQVDLGEQGYVYIVDNEGNIIYHPKQQLIYSGIKEENINFVLNSNDGSYIEETDGVKTVLSIKSVGDTEWKVVGISHYGEIMNSKQEIYSFFIGVIITVIAFVFIISIILSARISYPIKKLEKVMKRVENGELDIYADVEGEREVEQLAKTFNLMIGKIRQLMDEIVREHEEKRKSEIKALQAQINPHFLYNTLDSIVWMAENDENQGVVTMVTALADLFRTSISRGRDFISIEDELRNARSYLIIQQMRYGDKFQFTIEAEGEVLNYKIIKVILQPIIENAILHGIVKSMVSEGEIIIRVEETFDKILLKVIDNGDGMSQDKVDAILNKAVNSDVKAGIGVNNVNERIRLYFGEHYGIEIESELEEGTTVKVWLPKVR